MLGGEIYLAMHDFNSIDLIIAYFDPGAGSLLVQALVGGAAGLLVFAKYLWESAPSLLRARKPRGPSKRA
jgi:hypothetical protein